jgi:hypothetical protein
MVILYYNLIDGIDIDKITTDVINKNPNKIVIFNELEWELKQPTIQFVQFLKVRNVQLEIIFGSFHTKYYDDYCDRLGLDYYSLTFWPTYWMPWAEMCLKTEIDHTTYQVNTDFKYPFICLNNKNHIHRCALIDHLSKYNLIDRGIVTWHKFANSKYEYDFNYYDDSIRTINDDFATKLDSFVLPDQWHESFLHVIGEATINADFITEKTVIPLLLKQPFVCISTKNWNQRLLDLGFVLYDEIIDYSYDKHDDVEVRADKLCESISKLSTNYSELYKIIEPKIQHNYNRCLEIIKDKTFIPSTVIDRVIQMSNSNYTSMHTDPRYETIVRNCND